ncbi:MAG: PSP1 domain-containing protein, partial [Planctomycetota bacterium]
MRTKRGVEIGQIKGPVQAQDREEIKGLGEILRKATEDDLKIAEHISAVKEIDEKNYCSRLIKELELPMTLAAVEHLFGGDKIIFYFLADGRVDFRALVKDLAKEYRTRIEMRQIGVRDEARLLADYEHCGQELCCRTFMQKLEPVMMRMAKLQKTTLDPNKISGHCGRLMCCLRFEDEVYAELKKQLPKKGSYIRTEEFEGEVIDYNILQQTCLVEVTKGERHIVSVDQIVERRGKGGRSRKQGEDTKRRSDRGDRSDRGGRGDRRDRKGGGDSAEKSGEK